MHWLEFMISKHATWFLGHPSLICALTTMNAKHVRRLVLKRMVGRYNSSLEKYLGYHSVTLILWYATRVF